jgi:hypothetical protein
VRLSAISLMKCGSVWGLRPRSDGLEIKGEEACREFLTRYRDYMLERLIAQIREMDRTKLMILAAGAYQAARAEQQHWRETIKAVRAIRGKTADTNAFKRQNAINVVQRGAKSICEIAACEARETGGLDPGRIDLEEMFARVLLLFGNGQLFASIRTGLIEPVLGISPAGDLLSDRSMIKSVFTPGLEWTNRHMLDEAAERYARDRSPADAANGGRLQRDRELREAIEAEYGVSAEAFVQLQYALVEIAEKEGAGAFAMKRSELCGRLARNEEYPIDNVGALLDRLTLTRRQSWRDRSSGLTESDIDLSRLDRRFSIVNRPLPSINDEADPLLLVAPIFVSDSTMYSLSGLIEGTLNNQFWISVAARKYAGRQGDLAGKAFENDVAERLRGLGLKAWPRRKLSWALNEKVDDDLGDMDLLAVSPDRRRVWVIEAKNLRLCRTEAEVAARLSEYRGQMVRDSKGHEKPDQMLRHQRRIQYLRERRDRLCHRLELDVAPEVRGLLIFDTPQPMNSYMIERFPDSESVILDAIGDFRF